ncbi:MAG: FAD-dependent oxidoreductase [Chloroflexi bacterium]|nr:FAD-dependent oxidoreductase [Chloroflexota bacterium]
MTTMEKLFQPIKIGSLELPNRIIMPAISNNFDFQDDDRWERFYARRAEGGAGLLTVGALQVLHPGRRGCYTVDISDDKYIPRLRKVTGAVRKAGGRTAAQLAIYGYWSKNGEDTTAEDVGPSALVLPAAGDVRPEAIAHRAEFSRAEFVPRARALTLEEVRAVETAIGKAAVRAREAGFDAVELQIVGGNLLVRFINPFTNQRTDEYGGSLDNRLRIVLGAIRKIKEGVGDDFPLMARIPGTDMVPWGLQPADWQEVASRLEQAGVHLLSVYPGWHETVEPRHHMCVPRGKLAYLAREIKQAVSIPVATNVRINDPILAEQILAAGMADLIGMGRSLIADPDLPNKAREGRFDDIRLCLACGHCHQDRAALRSLTCAVNAEAGREAVYSIVPAEKAKKVFVIGGGPSGMEAARVAALRGHAVTLFEKGERLGGQLRYAALPPFKEELGTLPRFQEAQLRKLGVAVRLNEECTVKTVEIGKPDAVVVAAGAAPLVPDIEGIEGANVVTALEVLAGGKTTGMRVAVIGGGLIGCETAEFLLRQGRQVTILEALERIGADVGEWNRWVLISRLKSYGLRVETNSKAVAITGRGVKILRSNVFPEFYEADSVVLAIGMKPVESELAGKLAGKGPPVYAAGDCVKPARIAEAVESGYRAGMMV